MRNNFLAHFLKQLRDIITGHQFITLAIDNRSLVVSYIVILKQLLTYIEVASLNLALCLLNGASHHAMFDGLTMLHTKLAHEIFNTLTGKNTQQIILHREVESGIAWITLTTSTAAQLVINAARLMTLSTDDMQTTSCKNLFMALLPPQLELI